jgi:MFS family permease
MRPSRRLRRAFESTNPRKALRVKKYFDSITPKWRVVIFLFFAAGLNYADRTALASVIPPLKEDMGVTDVQIGVMGMLFLWTYAVFSPFAGNVADRFSRTKIVVWSLVGWSAVTVLTGLAWSIPVLYAMRIALGVAECFYLPAAVALIGDHHGPETRGKATGMHLLGLNIGVMLGGAAAGLLAESFGWRFGFLVLGGAGLILALSAHYFLSDGPNANLIRTVESDAKTKVEAGKAWAFLLRVPSFYITLLAQAVAGVASWIFLSWLPLYFNENYGLALGAAGLMGVALYKAPVVIGVSVGGWISDRVALGNARNRVMLKALSFIISGPFLLLMLGNPSLILVSISLIISSTIRAIGSPSEHPIICDVVPPAYRSTAVGIFNTCGTAAGGLGVLLAGIFKQDLGLSFIFGASSFLYIFAGAMLALSYFIFVPRDISRAQAFEAATLASAAKAV